MWKSKNSQIDEAEEMLADILEHASRGDVGEERWQQWKEKYNSMQKEGAMGRLYARIWEVAQVVNTGENKRRKEQEYLKDLMSDISHQMKTPLASLQVFVDIFSEEINQENGKNDEEKQAVVRMAEKQIERMRWLVTGMLKLAQVESGVYEFDFRRQSLDATISKSVDALKMKADEKEIRLVVKKDTISEGEVLLNHDSDWLQEAYTNLIKNAIAYAPMESEIIICMEETPLAVTVSVEDSGEGIPKEELPKIFNRFYRVHKTGQREEGVGIGLALAKSIVEANGGIITVYSSQGENSYTKFVTTFLK